MKRRVKRGFSLVEMLLVLGVLAVILLASFVIYPRVKAQNQARTEAVNLRMIQANVRNIYGGRGGSYTALGGSGNAQNPGNANISRVFPSVMNGGDYSKDAKVTSSWGGEVYVWPRPAITSPLGDVEFNKSFAIVYKILPPDVCVPFVTSVANNFQRVQVGKSGETKDILFPEGIDVAALTSACQDSSLSVTFTSL